jgi:hypothetical protein
MNSIKEGDKVRCLKGDIDHNKHKGKTGVINGFARFSAYHSREAHVKFTDGSSAYFWIYNVELA